MTVDIRPSIVNMSFSNSDFSGNARFQKSGAGNAVWRFSIDRQLALVTWARPIVITEPVPDAYSISAIHCFCQGGTGESYDQQLRTNRPNDHSSSRVSSHFLITDCSGACLQITSSMLWKSASLLPSA